MASTQPSAAFLPAIDAERSGSAGGYSNGNAALGGQVEMASDTRLPGSSSRPSLKQFPRHGMRKVRPGAALRARALRQPCMCHVPRVTGVGARFACAHTLAIAFARHPLRPRGAQDNAHVQSAPAVGRQAGHEAGATGPAAMGQRKQAR